MNSKNIRLVIKYNLDTYGKFVFLSKPNLEF